MLATDTSKPHLLDRYGPLADEYGTPLLVLSALQFKRQLEALGSAWSSWPGTRPAFYFPLKANDFVPFLRLALDFGLGFDITDPNELDLTILELGARPYQVVLNGPAKDSALLRKAVAAGIRVHVDSYDELHDLRAAAKDAGKVANVGLRLRFGGHSKFGFAPGDPELEDALKLLALAPELALGAVHQHDPPCLNSSEQLELRLRAVSAFLKSTERHVAHHPLEIDLGGGLKLDRANAEFKSYSDFVVAFRRAAECTGTQHLRFAFEWGRAIAGPCGVVISKVVRRKESEGKVWVYIDAGRNIVGGGHANIHHAVVMGAGTNSGASVRSINVAGPLCFASDVVADDVCALDPCDGDLVAICEAGAYTFNTRWRGAGRNPVVLLEEESGITHVGRLFDLPIPFRSSPGVLADLFQLFFNEEFGVSAGAATQEAASGISAGTNQLDPPDCLKHELIVEARTCESIKSYTGPFGSDEIVIAALAYEGALAGATSVARERCTITLGAAQGCARALDYLYRAGFEHCLVLGPQYPLVHDLLKQARYEITEAIGGFEDGYLPTASWVAQMLRSRPRSVVFLTVPNNPSGTCPTEAWLKTVFEAVAAYESHIIIDRSSEDLPLAPWMVFSPTTLLAFRTLRESAYTIINSISKSRSVPGLRLGYLLGSSQMVQSVADFNYAAYLSFPRTGTRFVASDLILRTIWWRHNRLLEQFDVALKTVKSAVVRSDIPSISEEDFVAAVKLFSSYTDQCTSALCTIKQSQREFLAGLDEHWLGCTPHQNGFNVIAEIGVRGAGPAFSKELFRATAIRLLPGECFRVHGRPLPGCHDGLTFRLSTADKPHLLRGAAVELRRFLERRQV